MKFYKHVLIHIRNNLVPKANVVKYVASETGHSKANSRELIDCVLDAILSEVVDAGALTLQGFGIFTIVNKPERKGSHPATGEPMVIKPRTVLKFKPSKSLKLTK